MTALMVSSSQKNLLGTKWPTWTLVPDDKPKSEWAMVYVDGTEVKKGVTTVTVRTIDGSNLDSINEARIIYPDRLAQIERVKKQLFLRVKNESLSHFTSRANLVVAYGKTTKKLGKVTVQRMDEAAFEDRQEKYIWWVNEVLTLCGVP